MGVNIKQKIICLLSYEMDKTVNRLWVKTVRPCGRREIQNGKILFHAKK